jgi:hypothetical protein
MSCLSAKFEHGIYEPIAFLTIIIFDETQLTINQRQLPQDFCLKDMTHIYLSFRNGQTAMDAKVMNTELHFAFVIYDVVRDRSVCFHIEMPTPLTTCDRSTAINIERMLSDLQDRIPLLSAFRKLFKHCINLLVRDRASSNLLAEQNMFNKLATDLNLGLHCAVHNLHTSVKVTLAIVDDIVSGVIAFALTMKQNGAFDTLSGCLHALIVQSSVPIRGGVPPEDDSVVIQYRDAVLEVFAGACPTLAVRRRLVVLRHKVKSNLQVDSIDVFIPGAVADEDVAAYANKIITGVKIAFHFISFYATQWYLILFIGFKIDVSGNQWFGPKFKCFSGPIWSSMGHMDHNRPIWVPMGPYHIYLYIFIDRHIHIYIYIYIYICIYNIYNHMSAHGNLYVSDWARDVATALLPSMLKVFTRHRWCSSREISSEVMLLCLFFNVLQRVIPLYLVALGKKLPLTSWQEFEESDIVIKMLEGLETLESNGGSTGNTKTDDKVALWVAFNEKQRGSAMRLARNSFLTAGSCLWHVCLAPFIDLMFVMLDLCSDEWEKYQQARAVLLKNRDFRMVQAAKGIITDKFFVVLLDHVFGNGFQWRFIPSTCQTEYMVSLAFAMVARSLGAAQVYIAAPFLAYPFRLWLLLALPIEDAAALIFRDPDCMWRGCSFSVAFRLRFKTELALRSQECLLVLELLAIFARFDTVRIECRNARIRKILLKGVTWVTDFLDASSDWLLLRQNTLLGFDVGRHAGPLTSDATASTSGANHGCGVGDEGCGEKTGGGGTCRSFFNEWMQLHPKSAEPIDSTIADWFKKAHASYQELLHDSARVDELAKHQRQGLIATTAHRVGGASFGMNSLSKGLDSNTDNTLYPQMQCCGHASAAHSSGAAPESLAIVAVAPESTVALRTHFDYDSEILDHLRQMKVDAKAKSKQSRTYSNDLACDVRDWQVAALGDKSSVGLTLLGNSPQWWDWQSGSRPRPMPSSSVSPMWRCDVVDWKCPGDSLLEITLTKMSVPDRKKLLAEWAAIHQRYDHDKSMKLDAIGDGLKPLGDDVGGGASGFFLMFRNLSAVD